MLVYEGEKIMHKKNLSEKKKYISLAGLICLAIIAVISFSKYQENSNINKSYATNVKEAEKLISEDKFSDAKQYYNAAMKYKNDNIIQEKIKLCNELEVSFKAFNNGSEALGRKDYKGAYDFFKEVIKEDTKRYDVAKTKMSESINLYIADQVKTANEFAIKGDFQKAIANIDLLLGVSPNDENAKNLKKKYEEDLNKKNEIKSVVTTENGKKASTSVVTVASDISVGTNITDEADITSKFTDKYFKRYVYSLIGKTSPSPILYSDVKNIKVLNVNVGKDWHIVQDYTYDIYSLSGLEYFTALTELYCAGNKLTTLDLSKNKALTILQCGSNPLKTLDVSKNKALTFLVCGNNQLTTLDVSENTALTKLWCVTNQLTTLDISKNILLTELECAYNKLTTLDVSKNTALILLECIDNQLTTLDVSKNTALTKLYCDNNKLKTLFTNTALIELRCKSNQLTTLDISRNTALQLLDCRNNQLTSLFSIKDTWPTESYRPQYTDSSHIDTTNSLVITIKD
jgi:tetratricopeptide (TPR) repeat protein